MALVRGGECARVQTLSSSLKLALLRDYAMMAFPFTLAPGVFLIGIAIVGGAHHPHESMWQFDPRSLRNGAGILFATLFLDFCVERATLQSRPFAWIKAYAQQRLGRVLVLHLTLIAGMVAMALSGSTLAVLYVLIGLKTLWGLATSDVREVAPTNAAPPGWMRKAGERLLQDKGGATALAEQWSASCATARRHAIEDERSMPR